eukprot:scaffold57822_cov30-Tisochrysis_lutea.AAC.4
MGEGKGEAGVGEEKGPGEDAGKRRERLSRCSSLTRFGQPQLGATAHGRGGGRGEPAVEENTCNQGSDAPGQRCRGREWTRCDSQLLASSAPPETGWYKKTFVGAETRRGRGE